MNKFLTLAAIAALFAVYNASPVLANDQADAQGEELAYAHEGDEAEMKGGMHKKDKSMKKHASKHEGKKESVKKADMKNGEKAKHHPHNPMKHKPHHQHNYYTDQQK